MKKIPKMSKIPLCAAVLCGAFLFPAATVYAEEFAEVTPIVEETVILETAEIPVITEGNPETVPESPPVLPPAEEPENNAEPPPENPVPGGNGSLIEEVTDEEVNRQFITVKSKNGNVFYIVIDRDSKTENVYFLNAVDEYDLMAFAENFPDGASEELESGSGNGESGNADDTGNTEDKSEQKNPGQSEETAPDKTAYGGGNSMMIVGVLAVAGIGGLVYFKVIKPKQGGKNNRKSVCDDEEDYEEDEPVNEDVSENNDDEENK
jgi:hypothetical protein